jgi:hypothetical protein
VPLCDLARAELAAVWPDYSGGAGDCWKLLGRAPGSGFSGYGRLLARLKARSGVVDWSWHDIRRAGRTTLTHLRVPEADAEAALNHVSGRSKLDRTYNHADAAPAAIRALRTWQGHVADILAARKAPGDTERSWRAGLPEHMRRVPRRTAARPKKAKPGPKRRAPACVPSVGTGTTILPR